MTESFRSDWPYLTADVPGTGGVLKHEPEDFVVEEIPLYPFSGEGEHLLLWIEKRDVAAEKFTRHIARELGVSPRDVGVAGLKDRRAVTRQWISVPAKCEPLLAQIETKRIRLFETTRHKNKLRTGHLKGNRFSILIRDVGTDALATAEAFCESAQKTGLPNYFGDQRMGREQETLKTGFALMRGEITPRDLPASQRAFLLRMSLSSVQSQLFNEVLADRIDDRLMHTVLAGDVMQVTASGGLFVAGVDAEGESAADVSTEQERLDRRETGITGPLFGPKMKVPTGVPAERETAVLARYGIGLEAFEIYSRLTSGTRRPLLVFPEDMHAAPDENGVRVSFTLPSGSYATVVLREAMKSNDE